MEDLQSFKKEFPDVHSSSEWIKKHPEQFYVPFSSLFYQENVISTDFTYLDKRKTFDKHLFEGIPQIEDVDSVKRSELTVRDGKRYYSNLKVPKIEKSELPIPIDKQAKKISELVGLVYFDTAENTRHKIHSIITETDISGKKKHSLKIENIGEDDENSFHLVACMKFVDDSLSKTSIYRFDSNDWNNIMSKIKPTGIYFLVN